ncbi:MAG: hypothetical protein HY554_01895 [Elusimicrobia bacterium]|nr:hypothetical protein [Elusimicrobiota bacterium]
MKILGLSLGDTSTAALFVRDRIVAAVSEERFSRTKRDERFPERSIDFCLKSAGLRGSDLDAVVFGSTGWDFWRWLTHYHSQFSLDDLIREQEDYWRPLLYEGRAVAWPKLFRDRWDVDQFPGGWGPLAKDLAQSLELSKVGRARAEQFLDEAIHERLGVPAERIIRVDAQAAFSAYAYWSSPFRGDDAAVVILDSDVAGLGASVSLPNRFGLMRTSSHPASEFLLGRIMRGVSLMLGLPPRDHDPVLLGLAAHARPAAREAAYKIFRKHLEVDGYQMRPAMPFKDAYFHFLERLKGLSDEAVAGGIQAAAEDLVSEWAAGVLKSTRAKRLAIAGSLSMNHKIMARVAALRGVEDLFVPPGAGEGALALGACYHAAASRFGATPAPLRDTCLGPDIGASDVTRAVEALRAPGRSYDIVQTPDPRAIAQLLARGAIVARCVGRAEFGARGLGNRSILCDPRNPGILSIVGAKIKGRDPFVPFSPTILAGPSGRYISNPKGLASPFMNHSFNVTPRGRRELAATVTGADRSVRPQILEDSDNPGYAALLRAFQAETGVPALLNTSLNLRGEAMALTASDAARVFEQTSIDYLLLGDILVGKRSAALRRSGGASRAGK